MTVGRGKGGEAKEGPTTELERFYASQFAGETSGIRTELASQIEAALKGQNVQIPLAQQAVERTAAAGAQTQKQMRESFASAGIGRTPQAQQMLTEAGFTTELAKQNAMTDIQKAFMGMAPNYGTAGLAALMPVTQAEVGYEGMTTSMANSKRAFNAQVMSSMIQAGSSAGAAAA